MKRLKFKYITPFIKEEFFITVKKGMNDAAELLGVDVEFTGTEDADCQKLNEIIIGAVSDGYDGLAVSIVHPTAMNESLEKAMQSGVPVISFNIDSKDCPFRLSTVSQNLYKAGMVVGSRVLANLAQNTTVLATMHDDVEALRERLQGIKSALGIANVKVIVTGNTPELAAAAILKEMETDHSIGAVLGTGQSDTHGAGLAVKRLIEDRKVYVAGFDLCAEILDFINEGIIDFSIDQQPYVQGFYPLLQLYQYVRFGIVPSDINAGNAVVSKENIKKVISAAEQGYR